MAVGVPIRILHLSDFHFNVERRWDADPVLAGVSEAVRDLVSSGLRPDIVALTGDIAFSGKTEEYDLASRWIDESLFPALDGLPRQNLFVIPGNHDVNRTAIDDDVRRKQDSLIREANQEAVARALTGMHRSSFLTRHDHFLKFLNRFPPNGGREDAPWWSTTREVGWGRLGILGLNTAWMSCGDEDHGKLVVGLYQVQTLLDKLQDAHLIVALMHHPLSHLHEFDSSGIAPRLHRKCRLILSGHLHRHKGARVEDERGTTYLELAAGAVYEGSSRPNAFQLIEIHPPPELRVCVHYRVWHREEWVPDSTAVRPTGVKTFFLGTGQAAGVRLRPEGTRRTNLAPASSRDTFLGREDHIQTLRRLFVEEDARLVTIFGAGGTGKTRLSKEAGLQLVDEFPGGVWFADLTEARTGPGIVKAIAAALDVQVAGTESPERALADVLEYRDPLLLILDNFEQVVEHAGATLGLWRMRAPHIRFLVTSRKRVGEGERIVEIRPLSAPSRRRIATMDIDRIKNFDAVKVFVDRARHKKPGCIVSDRDYRNAAKICADLEGIPLAIEIAAARVEMMSVGDIARKLESKMLEMLGSPTGAGSRHRTMETAIGWSYDLLTPSEQRVFLQLGVFRGGFSYEAVEEIVGLPGGGSEPGGLTGILHNLISGNLLLAEDTRLKEVQYRMFIVIREFCEGKWKQVADAAERRALEDRHAGYFLRCVERWDGEVRGPRAAQALDRTQLATENVIIAFDRKMEAGDPETAARAILALSRTLTVRNKGLFRQQRLQAALEALDARERSGRVLRARLLVQISEALSYNVRPDQAMARVDEAVAITRELGHPVLHANAQRRRAIMCMRTGDLATALELARAVVALAKSQDDDYEWCAGMELLGMVANQQGRSQDSLAACEAADPVAKRLGGVRLMARLKAVRASAHMTRDDYRAALGCFNEAVEMMRSLSADAIEMEIGRAGALARLGQHDEAIAIYAALEQQAIRYGNKKQIAHAQANRADACMHQGGFAHALELTRTASSLFRKVGDQKSLAIALGNMAKALCELGEMEEARERAREALEILDNFGNAHKKIDFIVLCHLVRIELASGSPDASRAYAARARALIPQLDLSSNDPEVHECQAVLATYRTLYPGED